MLRRLVIALDQRAKRGWLEAGERIQGIDQEASGGKRQWSASNRALYIWSQPNGPAGQVNLRIASRDLLGLAESKRGRTLRREVTYRGERGVATEIGYFDGNDPLGLSPALKTLHTD